MQSILDAINEWIKDILIGSIQENHRQKADAPASTDKGIIPASGRLRLFLRHLVNHGINPGDVAENDACLFILWKCPSFYDTINIAVLPLGDLSPRLLPKRIPSEAMHELFITDKRS